MGKKATLKDVAALAGVGTTTVSYILNNKEGQSFSPETRKRVLQAVKELDYTPNNAARALRRQQSGCIGVVTRKSLAVPRFSQILQGIQSRLADTDYDILLCRSPQDQGRARRRHEDFVDAYRDGRVDGVIFLGHDNKGPGKATQAAIKDRKIPVVVFDCQERSSVYSTVDFDYRGGAELLTRRVLERGPRRVLYVRPDMDTAQERLREEGVLSACGEKGVDVRVASMPITADNLSVWDARYSQGMSEEASRLVGSCVGAIRPEVDALADGDALIASWSDMEEVARVAFAGRRLVLAELANNGENRFGSQFYTQLPNYFAGKLCAEELVSRIKGNPPTSRLIDLNQVVSTEQERSTWLA